MFKNYFKIAIRNIFKHKGYSFINILGLGMGITVCILILIWVQDELSFDRFHEKKDHIYRIMSDWESRGWEGLEITPAPLAPAMENELPEVVHAARFVSHARLVFKYKNTRFYEEKGIMADPSLFQIFTFPFIKGELKSAFQNPTDMVITESFGRKYFGNENPMGKTMLVEGRPVTITGVIRDIPQNSHLQFDFVSSFQFMENMGEWTYNYGTSWNAFNFTTYVLLEEDSDLKIIGNKLTKIGERNECWHVSQGLKFWLQPLSEVYLTARDWNIQWRILGDRKMVLLFSVIAGFVLAIACVNFMNLTTARSALRTKEIGMRKTVGAYRMQLVWQFFAESIVYTLVAGLFALGLVMVLLPYFNQLAGKSLNIHPFDIFFLTGFMGIIIVTGFISGVYPAFFLSGFKPLDLFRSSQTSHKRGSIFRKILVVFQFAISIILIFGTLIIQKQFHYIQNRNLGFNQENVIYLPIKENVGTQYETMKNELLNYPEIVSVSAQYMGLTETWRGAGWEWEGRDPKREKHLDLVLSGVGYDFFKTLGLNIVEGRSFSEETSSDAKESVILNQSALQDMSLESPLGKWFKLSDDRLTKIIGIVKDANFQSLREKINNRIFFITDMSDATSSGIVLIRIQPEKITEGIATVRNVWESVNPISPFEFHFVDETYDQLYTKEMKASQIFNTFTLLAIVISCLGLFGLSSFMIERRTKEIGVRKVLGAPESKLILLLSQEFIRWVLIANLIAWPLGYFLMKRILNSYAYRINIDMMSFLLSGLLALGIALLTIWYQALKAARANPVKSLRYE